jgi:hypothetical protein
MAATDTATLWPTDPEMMRAAARTFDIKRLEPRFLDDPYPLYRALREHDPIPSHAGRLPFPVAL